MSAGLSLVPTWLHYRKSIYYKNVDQQLALAASQLNTIVESVHALNCSFCKPSLLTLSVLYKVPNEELIVLSKGPVCLLQITELLSFRPFHLQLLHRCKRHNQSPTRHRRHALQPNQFASPWERTCCFDQAVLTSIPSSFLLSRWEDCHPSPTWQFKFLASSFSTWCLLATASPMDRRSLLCHSKLAVL